MDTPFNDQLCLPALPYSRPMVIIELVLLFILSHSLLHKLLSQLYINFAKCANYFLNFSKSFIKYSGSGASNSIYSPVRGCTNPRIMA